MLFRIGSAGGEKMRKQISLNKGWLFHKGDINVRRPADKGPVYNGSKTERKIIGPAAYHYHDKPDSYETDKQINSEGWKYVNVPHDYIIDQDMSENENNANGYVKYDNAWYRKHITIGEEARGKRILLLFGGVTGKSTIYFNGCLMKHNFSSYNSFVVDVSANAYIGRDNVLAVYVNTEEFEGWWYQGGGIYRNVSMLITDPVAIDLYGVYAPTKKCEDNRWRIDFETTVVNDSYSDCTVDVKTTVTGADGREIAAVTAKGEVPLRDKNCIKYSADVFSPLLWDTENPNLYTVKTEIAASDGSLDESVTRIGFRTVEISPEKGLLLNGKKTYIKGVCSHQDYGLTGLAVPDNVARYKIELMKEMGANGFRTTHYQNSDANMDAFDELGFLVMDESRWFEATDEAIEQLETLIKRDRNRPSVIFWSTSNEEPLHMQENGRLIHMALAARIRKLDNTRFITAAECHSPEKSTIYDCCDVIGINYNLEVYDTVHSKYPEKAIFSSECCATGTIRDWNLPGNLNGKIISKDHMTNNWFRGREETWKYLNSKPYVIGGYQWAAVEHRGEAEWPVVCSKSGAMDLFLQKKGAFYQNRSHWTEKPMVHIVPHWNYKGLEGRPITVAVYTNCEELELFLNGKSLGKKTIEKFGHGEWEVAYEPGELKAVGYCGGETAAQDVRKTSKRACRLVLKADNKFRANGEDLALFTCECVDEDGLPVPDADEFVRFSATAPAKIVGTGSANDDHIRVTLAERRMYAGKISVAVRPAEGQQTVELFAQSSNCGTAVISEKANLD